LVKSVNPKICIMTSQHQVDDVRIYQKEIKSLLSEYNNIIIIGKKSTDIEKKSNIQYLWVNNKPGLFFRFLRNIEILLKAIILNAQIYHLHDPDLIYVGILLKVFFRKIIVYDIHEYFVDIIRHRNHLNKRIGYILSLFYKYSEKIILPFFDLLILAEESYVEFYKIYRNVVIVQNYVKKEYILKENISLSKKDQLDIVSLGGITTQRGIWETLELFKILGYKYKTNLHLIGSFENEKLKKSVFQMIEKHSLLSNFKYYGYVEHEQAIKLIRNFDIGVFLLHPIKNYTTSLPTKLFEFMGNGLTVICSDFEKLNMLNHKICFGLTVNIFNLDAEKDKIFRFIDNKMKMKMIRMKNIETVKKHYLWEFEEEKLLNAYHELI